MCMLCGPCLILIAQLNSFVATSLFLGSVLLLTFIAKEACFVVSLTFFSLTSNCVVGINSLSSMQDGNQSMVTNEIVSCNSRDAISVCYFTPWSKNTRWVVLWSMQVVDKKFPQMPWSFPRVSYVELAVFASNISRTGCAFTSLSGVWTLNTDKTSKRLQKEGSLWVLPFLSTSILLYFFAL